MSKLEIRKIYEYDNRTIYDFFIDGGYFPEKVGIGTREKNLCFYDFDLDYVEIDRDRFPLYDRKAVMKRAVQVFLAKEKPQNQFGTGRVILYRCHCGCDYCGVISFTLTMDEQYVYWQDIRYEDDLDGSDEYLDQLGTDNLTFNRNEYEQVFNDYLSEI